MIDPVTLKLLEMRGRIDAQQVALLLNVPERAIPVLVRHHLLKPLGAPSKNSTKWFARVTIVRLAQDEAFLHRLTLCLERYYKLRNEEQQEGRNGQTPHTKARNAAFSRSVSAISK